MVQGAFKNFRHEHYFETENEVTLMTDIFSFEAPLWFFGSLANWLFLTNYMKRLLSLRNQVIKNVAESNRWKEIIPEER